MPCTGEVTVRELFRSFVGVDGDFPRRARIFQVTTSADVVLKGDIPGLPIPGQAYPSQPGDFSTQGLIADSVEILAVVAPCITIVQVVYSRATWGGQNIEGVAPDGMPEFFRASAIVTSQPFTYPLVYRRQLGNLDGEAGFIFHERQISFPRSTTIFNLSFNIAGTASALQEQIGPAGDTIHTDLSQNYEPAGMTTPEIPEVSWLFKGAELEERGASPVGDSMGNPQRIVRVTYTWHIQRDIPEQDEVNVGFPEGDSATVLAIPRIRPFRSVDLFYRSTAFTPTGNVPQPDPVYIENVQYNEGLSTNLPGLP